MIVSTYITLFIWSFAFNIFLPRRHFLELVVAFSKPVSSDNASVNRACKGRINTRFRTASVREVKFVISPAVFSLFVNVRQPYQLPAKFQRYFAELISQQFSVLPSSKVRYIQIFQDIKTSVPGIMQFA